MSYTSDTEKNLKNVKECLKEAGQILKNEAGESIDQAVVEVKKRSAQVQHAVTDYVHDNPMKSLGWAVLGGVLLGFLLRK
ncbi:MAG TPA: hypothetical protein VHE99_07495 [Gammaproteobacteria bacterium]|nr:hypothetical protein [Gammaproteobacteria bacterium]